MAATATRSRSRTPTPAIWTYGLPERIRSDNGQPFASCALGRLSQLSVWWLQLGIRPELIQPASPHQNGRHERMHRDLKAETTRPAAPSRGAQQRRFHAFRHTFNEQRPHEALDQRRPAALYARPTGSTCPGSDRSPIRSTSRSGRPGAAHLGNLECVLRSRPPGLAR
jgi:transposase InsO family protein